MAYAIAIARAAEKALVELPAKDRARVREAIDGLAENPRSFGVIKLTARDEYRLRVGDYRVIFAIDDAAQRVTVREVVNRRDSYKR